MTNMDSGQPNSQPAPGQGQVAEKAGVQPSSPQFSITEELRNEIREEARRAVQAKEDRATARLEDRVDKIEAMVKKGMTGEQIKRELAIDDILSERSAPQQQTQVVSPTSGTPAPASNNADLVGIYGALGLDANDPEVLRISASEKDAGQLSLKLIQLKQARASAPASLGGVSVPGGSPPPNTETVIANKTRELQELQREPTKNINKIREVMAELRRLNP